jgi:hypothetical protein
MLRLFVKYFVKMAWQHILYKYVVFVAGRVPDSWYIPAVRDMLPRHFNEVFYE